MKKLFSAALALTIGLSTYAQSPVDLKIKPEIGKPIVMNMIVKTDVEGPQNLIMDMNMKMDMKATAFENELYTIDNTTKSIKVDINADMMTMSYNSEEEPADEIGKALAEQFSKIIDQTVTLKMDNKGNAVEVNLPDSFKEQGFDQSSFANITTALPEKAVSVGESWESTIDTEANPMLSKTVTTSTFTADSADGYVINVVGKLFDKAGAEIGSMNGKYVLDKATCLSKSGEVTTSVEMQGAKITSNVILSTQ